MAVLKVIKGNGASKKVEIVDKTKTYNKKLISVLEFAEMYGIGKNKAYELANMRDFPAVKNGRKTLIISSKIDDWFIANIGLEF